MKQSKRTVRSTGPLTVLRADEMGFCFGVRDAIDTANGLNRPEQISIFGELVHNPNVLDGLREKGFRMMDESERDQLPQNQSLLITAHGVSRNMRNRLKERNNDLIDTTCPLVENVHRIVMEMQREGRHVIVIGKPDHVEVRGLTGDLRQYSVLSSAGEVRTVDADRIGVVCQTTSGMEEVQRIVTAVREKNPEADVRFENTVCAPTKNRQTSVLDLVENVEKMVVVGGKNSNNTRQLVQTSEEHGVPAHHIQTADQLCRSWFADTSVVGLTAGASTPDETIERVYETLNSYSFS